jgi:cell division transport system permease protein
MSGWRSALGRPLDLPLERDGSGRFLPWIVALMVYLAALALAGAMAAHGAVARWDSALAGTMTVQLPPGDPAGLEAALAVLRKTSGVLRAEPLDAAGNRTLLEPWLGAGAALEGLALPQLIDLRVDPAAPPDRAALARSLAAAAPSARLDSDRRWLDPLFDAAFAAELLAAAILIVIGAAAVLSIVFATRTSLAIHHGAIEVLHLIGARDAYIAGQFQHHALRLGLRGAVIGLLAAGLTLLALRETVSGEVLGAAALPRLALDPAEWAMLLGLAPLAGATALATARLTVLRRLARMP